MTFPFAPSTNNDDLADQVRSLTREYQRLNSLVSGWTKSGGTDPYFDFLRARSGFFDTPILESFFLRRDTSQSIAGTGVTGINWTNPITNTGLISHSSVTNSSRIILKPVASEQNQLWIFSGQVDWEGTPTTGERVGSLLFYRSDDTLVGGPVVFSGSSAVANADVFSWSVPTRHNSSIFYAVLELQQNSGGSTGISLARIAAVRIA